MYFKLIFLQWTSVLGLHRSVAISNITLTATLTYEADLNIEHKMQY